MNSGRQAHGWPASSKTPGSGAGAPDRTNSPDDDIENIKENFEGNSQSGKPRHGQLRQLSPTSATRSDRSNREQPSMSNQQLRMPPQVQFKAYLLRRRWKRVYRIRPRGKQPSGYDRIGGMKMPEAEPARKRRTSANSCEGQGDRETHRTDDSEKYTAVDQECEEDRAAPQRVSENLAPEQRVWNKIRGGREQ